jgi:hypothetical protein
MSSLDFDFHAITPRVCRRRSSFRGRLSGLSACHRIHVFANISALNINVELDRFNTVDHDVRTRVCVSVIVA